MATGPARATGPKQARQDAVLADAATQGRELHQPNLRAEA